MLKLHIKRDNINANINIVMLTLYFLPILKNMGKKPHCLVKWELIFILLYQETYILYKFLEIPLGQEKRSKIVKRAVWLHRYTFAKRQAHKAHRTENLININTKKESKNDSIH